MKYGSAVLYLPDFGPAERTIAHQFEVPDDDSTLQADVIAFFHLHVAPASDAPVQELDFIRITERAVSVRWGELEMIITW